MVKFRVHNIRFYEFKPHAIHRMAYDKKKRKLALSRTDNSIEIWDLTSQPFQEKIIPGAPNRSIESLVWCRHRLFSTGLHADLTEYDLFSLSPKISTQASSSACWCMSLNSLQSHLVVGTEDGHISLFEVTEEKVNFERSIGKQEKRVLCLAWDPDDKCIVSGSVDDIHIWNVSSGPAKKIVVGRATPNQETIVWCVAFTRDFQIVSGDSRGKVSFWDSKHGTQIDSIDSHKADVLTLSYSEENDSVCASGVDSNVVTFQRVSMKDKLSGPRAWVKTTVRSPHTHDVHAVLFAEKYVVSGGVDTNLNFSVPEENVMKCLHSAVPQSPSLVYCVPAANAMLLRYPERLELWRLGSTSSLQGEAGDVLPLSADPIKLVSLKSKKKQPIVCCAVSRDCRWLAYSTPEHLRLFAVQMGNDLEDEEPRVSLQRAIFNTGDCIAACRRMIFTPNSRKLITAVDGTLQVIAVALEPTLQSSLIDPSEDPKDAIHLMAVSSDGKYVATADHFSNVNLFAVKSSKLKVYASLPRHEVQPTAMAFNPFSSDLVVAYADQKVVEYSVTDCKYTPWSRSVPAAFLGTPNYPILGITFDPRDEDTIVFHDQNNVYVVNKPEVQCPANAEEEEMEVEQTQVTPSRQQGVPLSIPGVKISPKYKHLVHFEVLENDMALAVEVSPAAIFEKLPSILKRKKFGT